MIEATRATRRLLAAALVAPLVVGAAFVPLFRWMQARAELRQQCAQNGAMAPLLVLAVTTHREVGLVRQRGEEVEQVRRIGFFHLRPVLPLERLPRLLIVSAKRKGHESLTGR